MTTQAGKTNTASKKQDTQATWSEKAALMAHEKVDRAAETAASLETNVRERSAQSAEAFDEKKKALEAQVNAQIGQAKSFASQNPVATAGIAFAAGILVSSLLRRK